MTTSIRELQTNLPWTIRYSRDFRSSPVAHKDFAHALVHVTKALGKLSELVDNMDRDRAVADGGQALRTEYEKYVADLVVCALRAANTFPGGVIDLERVVVDRLESKNNVKIVSSGAEHRDATPEDALRRCAFCNEFLRAGEAIFEFDRLAKTNGSFAIVDGQKFVSHVGCGPR